MHTLFEAEVAISLGDGSDYRHDREPRLVGTLHAEFEGWLGDDIVETSGFWLVTEALAAALQASELTGFELADVVVTTGPTRDEFDYPPLPVWRRLVPTGSLTAGDDIAAVRRGTTLALSDRVLRLLEGFQIENAFLRPMTDPESM